MQSLQKIQFHIDGKRAFDKLFPELFPLIVSDEKLRLLAERMISNNDCDDSQSITNGEAIFSQFLAHDITFESTSKLKGYNDPDYWQNDRSFNLDLDCMYGQFSQDFIYDSQDRNKILLGEEFSDQVNGQRWYDLQRNSQCKAIIPDSRNDENIIVNRLHVLMIEFHNKMVDQVKGECIDTYIFKEARRRVIWHYQWLIVHNYLKKILDPAVFESLMEEGPRYYFYPNFLPLEFTGAAFRIGHSQTRERNRINSLVEKRLLELGVFERMEEYVDWRYLFDFGGGKVQHAKKIDTNMGKSFHDLPFIKADHAIERSLPFRNLKRGVIYGLPSGEDMARRLAIPPIEVPEKEELGLDGTPLWYYILKESEMLHNGEYLGPVGSILLGEVFMTLLLNDDDSYLKLHPLWEPELKNAQGQFDFPELINFVYDNAFVN